VLAICEHICEEVVIGAQNAPECTPHDPFFSKNLYEKRESEVSSHYVNFGAKSALLLDWPIVIGGGRPP